MTILAGHAATPEQLGASFRWLPKSDGMIEFPVLPKVQSHSIANWNIRILEELCMVIKFNQLTTLQLVKMVGHARGE